jgi:hypothetical protein
MESPTKILEENENQPLILEDNATGVQSKRVNEVNFL